MNRVGIVVGGAALAAVGVVVARKVRAALREMESREQPLTVEQEIENEYVVEDTGWAPELANAALDRLVATTPALARYHLRVVWLSRALAFTVPGRALYLTRALLDRPGMTEARVAFVIAHEAAHHVLGHLGDESGAGASKKSLIGAKLNHLVIGAKNELAADAYAMRACLRAGYDRDDVLGIFDIMSHISEDYGDLDSLTDDDDRRSFLEKLSGHPTIAARREALEDVE